MKIFSWDAIEKLQGEVTAGFARPAPQWLGRRGFHLSCKSPKALSVRTPSSREYTCALCASLCVAVPRLTHKNSKMEVQFQHTHAFLCYSCGFFGIALLWAALRPHIGRLQWVKSLLLPRKKPQSLFWSTGWCAFFKAQGCCLSCLLHWGFLPVLQRVRRIHC